MTTTAHTTDSLELGEVVQSLSLQVVVLTKEINALKKDNVDAKGVVANSYDALASMVLELDEFRRMILFVMTSIKAQNMLTPFKQPENLLEGYLRQQKQLSTEIPANAIKSS
jgi:hypothetical protein